MKKLSLKLGNQSLEKMSKDDMKKIKGGGDYDCHGNEPIECNVGEEKWSCLDYVQGCTFFACGEENPDKYDYGITCY